MRIGLFGGTFNPFHCGHLQACQDMIRRFDLDRMILIPAAVPPHKPQLNLASSADRLTMTRLATAGFSDMDVSDIELTRSGPSYSVDTLTGFRQKYSHSDDLFLVMGLDAFLEFHTWKNWQTILELCAILVMNRPGQYPDQFADKSRIFDAYIRQRFDYALMTMTGDRSVYRHSMNRPVILTSVNSADISSSQIRRMIRSGQPVGTLVPEPVARYLSKKGLYR